MTASPTTAALIERLNRIARENFPSAGQNWERVALTEAAAELQRLSEKEVIPTDTGPVSETITPATSPPADETLGGEGEWVAKIDDHPNSSGEPSWLVFNKSSEYIAGLYFIEEHAKLFASALNGEKAKPILSREEVARIIDPFAFADHVDDDFVAQAREVAIEKADAVLSLLAARSVQGLTEEKS